MSSRDTILNKLRAARRPFPDAPPRGRYRAVAQMSNFTPDGLLARFREELEALDGELYVSDGDDAAREQVLALLADAKTQRIASWHFRHIPVAKLYTAIQQAGYTVDYPHLHEAEHEHEDEVRRLADARVGLTGVDAVIAATGTLVMSTGEGKSRTPTVLPPVHIAVVTLKQLLPRLEDWLASQRAGDMQVINTSANVCFISGPSRTADIEKQLVVGVHGPGKLQVVVKR